MTESLRGSRRQEKRRQKGLFRDKDEGGRAENSPRLRGHRCPSRRGRRERGPEQETQDHPRKAPGTKERGPVKGIKNKTGNGEKEWKPEAVCYRVAPKGGRGAQQSEGKAKRKGEEGPPPPEKKNPPPPGASRGKKSHIGLELSTRDIP